MVETGTADALLEVDGIETCYGLSQVLFGLSLSIHAGEMVALMGRNGMGKTTTIRSIMGMTPARAGTIRFAGEEVRGLPSYRIAKLGIGLVPEGRQIFPNLTVYENLVAASGNRAGNADPWTIEKIHALFPRLAERGGNMGVTLSGGEQQMVAIGRALLGRPRLLMLDEPSLGLAPALVRSIFQSFVTLKNRGIAVLLVEQMAWLGLGICDRAYVLEGGKFLIQGTRDAVRSDARVVEAYLGQVKSRGLAR
jgi:branched-chain amino acid transport system ATP-binding protein